MASGQRGCVCVWNIWTNVKLLPFSLLFKISQALFRGWATNLSGPYMMGRTINPFPSMTQGTWSGHRFPPAPRFHCYILPQGTYKSLTTSRAVVAQNGLAAAGRVWNIWTDVKLLPSSLLFKFSLALFHVTSNNGTSTFVLTFLVSSALFQVIPSKGNREPGDWSSWTVNRMPPVGGYGKGWATCSPATSTRNKGAEWTRRWEPGDWSCWTVNRMPPVGGYGNGRAVCSPATSTKGWTRWWEPGDWSCWTVNRMPPVGGYGKGRAVCSPATSTKGWTRRWEPGDWSCWTVNRMPPVGGYGKGWAICSPATSARRKRTK